MLDLSSEFPQDPSLCYLNHAAMGPWPQRTIDALASFANENMVVGSKHYDRWLKVERHLRIGLAQLINANTVDDIALVKNTSEGLSFIAYGLPWEEGDEIVILDQEFPSNRIVWESLQSQGVIVKVISCAPGESAESALCNNCTDRTRLISVSSVQYASAYRIDLKILSQYCRDNGILFCVDAIQSVAALPIDVHKTPIDFIVADGHKWMLGPEGIALFYCAEKQRNKLKLNQYGWHMVKALGDYDNTDWEIAETARRFECGSPNMLGIHALNASISLILEIGIDKISDLVIKHTRYLINELNALPGIHITSETKEDKHGGIVTFTHDNIASQELYSGLREHNISCAHRAGGIRFSPHFYNTQQQLDYAVKTVKELTQAA